MTWNRNEPFQREKPVVAFVDGVETPFSVMLRASRIGFNGKGHKIIPEGTFICRMGNEYHCLPRANVTGSFTTTTNTGTIDRPSIFIPGDILSVIEGHHMVTFGGVWKNNTVITATLPTGAVTTIGLGYIGGAPNQLPLATIAQMVSSFFNNDVMASGYVFASAVDTNVYIFNKSGLEVPPITLSSSDPAATFTDDAKPPFTLIGTIMMIGADGTITLQSNANVNVPIGSHVGMEVEEIVGVYPHALEMTYHDMWAIAPVAGARGVFEGSLPYIDGDVKNRLPRIRFAMKF